MSRRSTIRDATAFLVSTAALGVTVVLLRMLPDVSETTVALALLLVVLGTATMARLGVAIIVSVVAMLAFNFFLLPPVGTLTIADPQNWIALFAFLVVAVIASNLSAAAQGRDVRRSRVANEVTRLFDLTRDVLLTTDTSARWTRRPICRPSFRARKVAIACRRQRLAMSSGRERAVAIDADDLNTRSRGPWHAGVRRTPARVWRARAVGDAQTGVAIVPLRHGTKAVGLLAEAPDLDLGTLDALGGVVAIAIERTQFLAERDAAELVRQNADLASTLLASFSHDLPDAGDGRPRRRLESSGRWPAQRIARRRRNCGSRSWTA